VLGSAAFAEKDHGHGDAASSTQQSMSTHGDTSGKMKEMGSERMGGMHQAMMGAMMSQADADGDGTVSDDEMRQMLQTRLSENDADGDQSLSPAEFEAMHVKMMQEHLADRFAQLDTDGNGAISSDEMGAHADTVERMQKMHSGLSQKGQEMDKEQD
jgi:Ca2+-binding EF-hand superfamily protein